MQGFYYLLGLIAFCVIVYWFIQNDKVPPGEPTKGILRMRFDGSPQNGHKEKEPSKSARVGQRD